MRAVMLREFGPPDTLRIEEIPTPEPGPGQAIVRVRACGVCYHDVLDRLGKLPNVKPPIILGHEIAGEVAEVGPFVEGVKAGDRVCILQRIFCGRCQACISGQQNLCRDGEGLLGSDRDGGYAEYVHVPAINLVKIPDSLSFDTASLLSCAVGTNYRAVRYLADVQFGETVLITGASGGLGLTGIQVAKLAGARVVAVTSSEQKVEAIKAAGADEVVCSPDLRFARAVWELTDRRGADVVLDTVVSYTFAEALRSLGQGGRYVIIGNVDVRELAFNPGLVISRRLRILGTGSANLSDLHEIVRLAAAGKINPLVSHRAPLAEAAAVHRDMEAKRLVGRVVLV
ncbi:MAG: alcohol dehydrogenase catalytic domain-containing protein [Chloroflexi bacterium]|nr:alcohol dehydrogenase catalytic domain-containing protein [Chloroflexota bacterium]